MSVVTSCKNENDRIEIYLIKSRVASKEGIPLSKIKEFREDNSFSKDFINGTNYDTIKHEFILAGSFDVRSNQLPIEPFILDSEIELLDTIKNEIYLTDSGLKKIKELEPNMIHGTQFVICNNKKPVFTGYFWSKYSSYMSTWNCIEYDHLDTKNNKKLKFFKGSGTNLPIKNKINFGEYKNFIEAFKKTNRLIE